MWGSTSPLRACLLSRFDKTSSRVTSRIPPRRGISPRRRFRRASARCCFPTASGRSRPASRSPPKSRNLSQGTLQATGNPLNFAIAGQGFFAVRTAQGVQYTRDGQFSANAQGVLVDQLGDPVLSQSGATIQVGADGTTPATSLGVFNLTTPTQIGNNNFTGTVGGKGTGTVEAGQLEGSGVDPIETMVDMTTSLDSYQAGQRAIETINQTMQESSATVGLVGGA